jgi:NAD(P)-dependent dehydrogenase (short-subunit alcohol dehydrogenase family)
VAKGTTVYATTRRPAESKELQKLAAGAGGAVVITQLDVSSATSVEAWAADLKGRVPHVDLLVNNAGVGTWTGLDATTAEEMVDTFRINTVGPLLVTQQLRKQGMLRAGSTVASMTSKMGSIDDNTSGGCYAYRASKAALNIVSMSLSHDLGKDGVTCVMLHPGFVRTEMTGGQGLISAQECVAGLLAVLERSPSELQGSWFDYAGKKVSW